MGKPEGDNDLGGERPAKKLPAVVQKIVKPIDPKEPEKAQIAVHGADDLYREIRIENTLEDGAGEKVRLKQGAEVDVIIEAPPDAVEKKPA
jgi:predicted DNA-binding antitoxin AbrB/MazE fold protein